MTRRLAILGSALLLSLSSAAAPSMAAQWLYYSEPDFELFGDASPKQVADTVRSMQVYRLARDKVLPKLKASDVTRPRVFVLSGTSFDKYAKYRRDIAGFVVGHDFGVDIVVDASAKDWTGTSSIVQHELTHYYLRQSTNFAVPQWFNEGLSEYLSTIDIKGGNLRIGVPAGARWANLQQLTWMPLRDMLAVSRESAAYNSHTAAPAFYAQSWALTHYILTMRGEDARKVGALLSYQDNGLSVDESIKLAFGADFPAFEDRVRKYSRSQRLQYMQMEAPPLPDLRDRIVPIDETRGMTELLLFAVRSRQDDPDVRELADRLATAAGNAKAAAAQALIARAEGDWNAATEALARCAANGTDDEALVLCGDAWMAPAWRGRADPVGADERTRAAALKAAEVYAQAWKANPRNFEAVNSMVLAYYVHRQDGPTIEAELRSALERYPGSSTLRFHQAQLQMARGEYPTARQTLERILMDSRDPNLRLKLIKTLREVENRIAAQSAGKAAG